MTTMTEYELYLERRWEARRQAAEDKRALWRGVKFSTLFVGPFWILFLYLWLR